MIRIKVYNGWIRANVVAERTVETPEGGKRTIAKVEKIFFQAHDVGEIVLLNVKDVVIEDSKGKFEIVKG